MCDLLATRVVAFLNVRVEKKKSVLQLGSKGVGICGAVATEGFILLLNMLGETQRHHWGCPPSAPV